MKYFYKTIKGKPTCMNCKKEIKLTGKHTCEGSQICINPIIYKKLESEAQKSSMDVKEFLNTILAQFLQWSVL